MIRRLVSWLTLTMLIGTWLATAGSALADGAVRSALPGTFSYTSPCNGEVITGAVEIDAVYQASDSGDHFAVQTFALGPMSGSFGNAYRYNSKGSGVFDAPSGYWSDSAPYFIVPYHAAFAGQGPGLTFTVDGTALLEFLPDGEFSFASFQSTSVTCTA